MSRNFNTSTKLGRLLKESGLKKWELGYGTGINERVLTEMLAGRRGFTNKELTALSAFFKVEPEDVEG